MATACPLTGFSQMAYVTNDFDHALQIFSERYGMTRFTEIRDREVQMTRAENAVLDIALAYAGPVQIELIRPTGGFDAIYRDALPKDGFALRFHHVAQTVDSEAELDRQIEAQRQLGVPIVIDGANPGTIRYFYSDQRATLGHYIEHCYYTPAGHAFLATLPRY